MGVLVVTIGLFDIAFEVMHRKVHLAQSESLSDAFDPVMANILLISIFLMVTDKLGTLDEHPTRTTGRIKDTSMKGLEDFDNKFHEGKNSPPRCPSLMAKLPRKYS